MKKPTMIEIPDLADQYPPYEFRYSKPSTEKVKVADIIGTFRSLRVRFYNDDWTPKKPDERWQLLYEFAVDDGNLNEVGLPHYPIRLVEFEGKYYVWYDGHRRVSIAKMLKKHELSALVTHLKRWRV